MKKLLLFTLLLTSIYGQSQELNIPDQLKLEERTMMLNNVERVGFTVILDGDEKEIRKQFETYLEETYKWSLKTKSKIIMGEDLFTPELSEKHFTVQSMVQQTGEGNEVRFFMSFGTDIYVNTTDYPKEAQKCLAILKDYSKNYYSTYVNKEVAEKNEEIADANKDLASVVKNINSNTKSSSKAALKKEKLEKKKVKTEEKMRQLQESITDQEADIVATETEVTKLNDENKTLTSSKEEIDTKIKTNQTSLNKLKAILEKINNY